MTDTMNLVVLYVSDLEQSARFYSALGIEFAEERHGGGPLHYSSNAGSGLVFELYPAGSKPVTRTRIGFRFDDAAEAVAALSAAGWTEVSQARDLDYGCVRVVRDPDGNAVELVETIRAAE